MYLYLDTKPAKVILALVVRYFELWYCLWLLITPEISVVVLVPSLKYIGWLDVRVESKRKQKNEAS